MTDFRAGDTVSWKTPQGVTTGKVIKKVTHETTFQGLEITASDSDPRYVVRSDSSGKYAAHTPVALRANS